MGESSKSLPSSCGSPILHGHAVRHVERLEAVHRLCGAAPRGENAGSMASRNGSASVAPMPRSTVRRGNDLVRKAMRRLLLQLLPINQCRAASFEPVSRIRNAGLSTIPRMSDDQR